MKGSTRPDTKAALLRAAERLFAEKGLGAVSARDITREAGARNQSALHYHFGGMEALMQEVFADRYRKIHQAQLANVGELVASGGSDDVEAIMAAAIRAQFEACQEEDGRLFARFCVQLVTDPRFTVPSLMNELEMSSIVAIRDLLVTCLADLPEYTVLARLRQVYTVSTFLVADYAREVESGTAASVEEATREAAASLSGFLRTMPSIMAT